MLTHQRAKDTYKHVLEEVLFQVEEDQPMYKALGMRGYDESEQLVLMTSDDIM